VLSDASSVSNVVRDAAIALVISSVVHARCVASEHESIPSDLTISASYVSYTTSNLPQIICDVILD